jgi:uncharacterized SAM-binding protein YcdF (DUF218 family)
MAKLLKWTFSFVVLLGVAWALGLVVFATTLPSAVDDNTTHTDAIVVLTGGSERIDTGLKLLSDGLADRLYISGVGGQLRRGDILAEATADPALKSRISLGTAPNTPGNATETAAWAHAAGVHSIRLVTAGYHMRRSLLELQAAMPDVRIIPHPVFPPRVKSDWWRWPGTASLIAREYTKFLLTWLRQRLGIVYTAPTAPLLTLPREQPPPAAAPAAPPAAP